MNKNLLTIVICTYNRAHILPEALESLLRQTVSPEDYYLLIIDNNSTDNTQEVLIPFKERFPYMRIVMEYNQGLSHARNRALKECQTEWLAFLDDDAKAHPDWVETILQTIEKGDFDGFGGPFYAWHHLSLIHITMAPPHAGFQKILAPTKVRKAMDCWKRIHTFLGETAFSAVMLQEASAPFQQSWG